MSVILATLFKSFKKQETLRVHSLLGYNKRMHQLLNWCCSFLKRASCKLFITSFTVQRMLVREKRRKIEWVTNLPGIKRKWQVMTKDRKKVTKGLCDQTNDREGMRRFFLKVKRVFMLFLYTEYVSCYVEEARCVFLLGLTVTVYYTFLLLCLVGGRKLIRMPRFLGSQPSSSLWLLFFEETMKR